MSGIKYCKLKCKECPTCSECGVGGNSLYTPGCKGCLNCVKESLGVMKSEDRRILAKRIFLYREIESNMTQKEVDALMYAMREEIKLEQALGL